MAVITTQSSSGGLFSIASATVNLGAEGPDISPIWIEPSVPSLPGSNGIITDDQTLTIDASWTTGGAFSVILASLPGVNWDCNVHLEYMGGGEHSTIYNSLVAYVHGATTCSITIPAGLPPGVYRLLFTMTLVSGSLKVPFGGFGDLGFVQVMSDF